MDSAGRTDLGARDGERARTPRRDRRSGDLRREPPEPLRWTGDSRFAAAALALSHRARDDEGVLQSALLSRAVLAARVVHQQPELLPLVVVLLRVPADAGNQWHAADAALYRRSGRRGIFNSDIPGRTAHRYR